MYRSLASSLDGVPVRRGYGWIWSREESHLVELRRLSLNHHPPTLPTSSRISPGTRQCFSTAPAQVGVPLVPSSSSETRWAPSTLLSRPSCCAVHPPTDWFLCRCMEGTITWKSYRFQRLGSGGKDNRAGRSHSSYAPKQ